MLVGPDADRLLRDPAFVAAWGGLHASCPDATCYQSPGFAGAWYRTYRGRFEPVVVRSPAGGGEPRALWLLAFDPGAGELMHAGAQQAEYHVWLAPRESAAGFVSAAWSALRRRLRFGSLRFRYLPDEALAEVLAGVPGVADRMIVRPSPRPLIRLSDEGTREALESKWTKRRLGGLRKLGAYELRRLRTSDELLAVFDDLIAFYDLRQGAVNRETPFADDSMKRPFHVAMFDDAPNANHVTVSFLDGKPIAALWAARTGSRAHLGILTHSPFHTKYTPGIVHLQLACRALLEDGVVELDLTPGGDAWKERLADARETAADVRLYASVLARRRVSIADDLVESGKRMAVRAGIPLDSLRRLGRLPRLASPPTLARALREWIGATREARVYRGDRTAPVDGLAEAPVRRNSIPDLLLFARGAGHPTRDEFLSRALARLEEGQSSFSVSIDGRLAGSAWLARGPAEVRLEDVSRAIALPEGSAMVYDFRTSPSPAGRGLVRALAGHAVRRAGEEGAERIYAVVAAEDAPARRDVESLGLAYQGSFRQGRRLGRETSVADPIAGLDAEPG